MLAFTQPLIVVGFLLLSSIAYAMGVSMRRSYEESVARARQVQAQAREKTRALCIGSAVHVAGHPNLDRDQPVILALKSQALEILHYHEAQTLASIALDELVAVLTVVYDDERVPHLDAIDTTAQALQVGFRQDSQEWTCLFRRMKPARPIDWYHAIQKARSEWPRIGH
jgi:hypothetical protein